MDFDEFQEWWVNNQDIVSEGLKLAYFHNMPPLQDVNDLSEGEESDDYFNESSGKSTLL